VYGLAVDWWSMGVLAFEMLVGRVPFAATNRNELYALTIKGAIEFPNTMSTNAVSFIRSLLVRNPRDRLGSVLGPAAIKNHPFFSASESGIDWVRVSCGEVPCAELLTRGLERKKEPASPSPGKTADNDGLSNNTHTNQKHFSSTAPQLALSSPPSSSSPHPSLPISNLSPEMKARQIAKRGRDVLSKSAVLPLSIGSARSFDAGSRSREQGSDLDALLASMQQHHENGW
jgi:serine/threonine protein kinase